MEAKPILASKTVWLNFIVGLIVTVIPQAQGFIQAHPEVSAMVLSSMNILMRIVTKSQVTLLGGKVNDGVGPNPS